MLLRSGDSVDSTFHIDMISVLIDSGYRLRIENSHLFRVSFLFSSTSLGWNYLDDTKSVGEEPGDGKSDGEEQPDVSESGWSDFWKGWLIRYATLHSEGCYMKAWIELYSGFWLKDETIE